MTAIERVRRARVALVGTIAGTAVLWAIAAAVAAVVLLALVDLAAAMPFAVRRIALVLAASGSASVAALVLWRGRHATSLGRVALFIEERQPTLAFALVTAVEATTNAHGALAGTLEQAIARVDTRGVVRRPAVRAIAMAMLAVAIALLGWFIVPASARARVLHPQPGDVLLTSGSRDPMASRLTPIVIRVVPPAYARQSAVALEDPPAVNALVGSRIEIRGLGAAAGLDSLRADFPVTTATLPVVAAADTWSVVLAMPAEPAALRLVDRRFDRLLTLEPRLDAVPSVALTAPARDTTVEVPRGLLVLTADIHDDLGLARAEFEVMHTSGSGERFETRRTTIGMQSPGGARTASLRATIRLDSMQLGPGDVLHVRALARDENDVTGPGEGTSDTRTIRVADPRERDTLNIYPAAALPLDTSAISQRMLNMRAESLLIERPRLRPAEFHDRASAIAELQATLRDKLESIITKPDEGGDAIFSGTPEILEVLRQASSAMVSAATALRVARVSSALPHMRRALALLERARGTGRLYLRGVLPKDVIDIAKVRLKGTEKATVAARDPRPAATDPRRVLLARMDRALALLAQDRRVGTDSLTMVRVAALTAAPDAAESLGAALAALERSADAAPALRQARRRLERGVDAEPSLSAWQGGGR